MTPPALEIADLIRTDERDIALTALNSSNVSSVEITKVRKLLTNRTEELNWQRLVTRKGQRHPSFFNTEISKC